MNIHSIKEYIKYQWTAKSRHRVHSPFVYNFIEQVLRNKLKAPAHDKEYRNYKWMGARYQRLLTRTVKYFDHKTLICVPPETDDETGTYDVLILKNDVPRQWVRLFNKYAHALHNNSIVLVAGIHGTERHTSKWNRLCNHPKVKMSMDLYGAGLLFFNDEFKEKQSFVLKY